MAGMAVVSIPAIPEGWHGRDLVRIVDPLGCVAGWIAPAQAGVLIGCHARLENPGVWHPIGIAHIDDAIYPLEPMVRLADGSWQPLRMLGHDWHLHVRDPTGAIVRGMLGHRTVEIATQLEDAGLRLSVKIDDYQGLANLEFALPPLWHQPPGTLLLDIEEGCIEDRKMLTIEFSAPIGVD